MTGLLRNPRILVAGLAAVALVLGALIYRDMFVPAKNASNQLNLYTVGRRTVTATVTGTGNLVPMNQSNVSFRASGILTEVDVRVGDHVTAGQVLAKIDPTSEQQELAAAQANLQVAEANLQAAEQPLSSDQISQLQHALQQAQQAYNDTVAQVNLTNSQDAATVTADKSQLTIDQTALNNSFQYQQDLANLAAAKTQLQTVTNTFDLAGCQSYSYPFTSPPAPANCLTYFNTVLSDQATVNTDQAKVNLDSAQVTSDQTKLNQDSAKQQLDLVNGQRSINAAAAQVTSARDQLNTQTQAKPNQIASAQAQLASAQTAVQTAQQNLNATTLTAPIDGSVNAINGVVGETVGPGQGTTSEAPGSTAPLPSTGTSSGTGTSFMVIGDDSAMEVVVPFAESDAERVAFNQNVNVTFDAVPNLTISGKVVAVASSATVSSGVVNYYATISLNQTNPGLREGMTSNAMVTVSTATNALTVPNLAITRLGGQAYVNVYANGHEVQTAIETGVVGDTYTEVTGGLNQGEQVVIPTLRLPSSNGTRGTGAGPVRIGGGG
ncbi:MAG TPA: biotin/lipoyl-binding protein [Candidatus Dormibacteraeota bacterium]|nr:biotin/lipoyl-binding protein [Candidatus Dormibacteraeota bacterium]